MIAKVEVNLSYKPHRRGPIFGGRGDRVGYVITIFSIVISAVMLNPQVLVAEAEMAGRRSLTLEHIQPHTLHEGRVPDALDTARATDFVPPPAIITIAVLASDG